MSQAAPPTGLAIPELGPALGRLVTPLPPTPGAMPPCIPLDPIRIEMISQLFELAGDARRWVREGDRELALATLNAEAWANVWSRAVQAVAEGTARVVSQRMLQAAGEARLPPGRARALPLDDGEVRGLAARLAGGAAALHQALAQLDQAAHHARSHHAGPQAVLAWQEALTTSARRLEAAWLALDETLIREWLEWEREVADLRRWRRPQWPLLVIAAVLFGAALYLGLVLGGYVPVPSPLRSTVEALWLRWS